MTPMGDSAVAAMQHLISRLITLRQTEKNTAPDYMDEQQILTRYTDGSSGTDILTVTRYFADDVTQARDRDWPVDWYTR